MKKYSWLTPVSILLFVLVTLAFLSPMVIKGSGWPVKQRLNLGLDLKGGTQIVLSVKADSTDDAAMAEAVEHTIHIIHRRINEYGVTDPNITKIGNNQILVQFPGLKNPEAATKLVTQAAVLEFRVVEEGEGAERYLDQVDDVVMANLGSFPALTEIAAEMNADEPAAAETAKVAEAEAETAVADDEPGIFRSLITTDEIGMYVVRFDDLPLMRDLLADSTFVQIKPKNFDLMLESMSSESTSKKQNPKIYVVKPTAAMKGDVIARATHEKGSSDDQNPQLRGRWYLSLSFTGQGARDFAKVTGANVDKKLAIVVDNKVYSAPVINEKIAGGKHTISGQFTNDEAKALAVLLGNKSLNNPIETEYSKVVSATLGADSVRSGLRAGLIGIIAVAIFMLIYYKLSGLLADIVLIFNVGFILAMLTAFKGTLTLPGIAGIVLTIGMAVDANVLIFERIREELDAGKTPRSAADAGFKRASVTIWDANLTTLIAAIMLYQFGTGPIRGFALTLTIGTIGTIFGAIVVVRYLRDKTLLTGNRKKLSI